MAVSESLRRIIVDAVCLAIVLAAYISVPSLFRHLDGGDGGHVPFRGFFCDDPSIRYPYRDSSISSTLVGAIGLLAPVLAMVTVETLHFRRRRAASTATAGETAAPGVGRRWTASLLPLHPAVAEIVHDVAVFLFGAGCAQLTTDVGKYTVDRLRPHFLSVCDPANLEELCGPGRSPAQFHENLICRTSDLHRLQEAKLSFPSGHASFSAYTMVYLALYLQARMTWSGSRLLRPFLQLSALMLTWYTGLSRVSDHKHHWSDVLAGFLIGTVAASLTALYVSQLFRRKVASDASSRPLLPENQRDVDLKLLDSVGPEITS